MSQSRDPSTPSTSTTNVNDQDTIILLRNEKKIRDLVAASCDAMLLTLRDGGWSQHEVAVATEAWLRHLNSEPLWKRQGREHKPGGGCPSEHDPSYVCPEWHLV